MTLDSFWRLISDLSTVAVLATLVTTVVLTVKGFLPVLWRLGTSLWRRKVAIFASGDALTSLHALLEDTSLISPGNLIEISSQGELGRADRADLFLVYWPDWKGGITEILQHKRDATALIVYAPQEHGFLPKEVVTQLEAHRNVVLSNFRGRLLNDILISMITTGYEKK
jgi:hypothetical protein